MMNIAPVIVTYIAYILGGAPYWLYIAMITIWAVGGNMVIIRYANKVSNLKIITFFREIVFPVISVVILMLALGYLPQLLMVEGFSRLIVSCVITSLVFIFMMWRRIFTNNERQMVIDFVRKRDLK